LADRALGRGEPGAAWEARAGNVRAAWRRWLNRSSRPCSRVFSPRSTLATADLAHLDEKVLKVLAGRARAHATPTDPRRGPPSSSIAARIGEPRPSNALRVSRSNPLLMQFSMHEDRNEL
jgi:hypothetical protein